MDYWMLAAAVLSAILLLAHVIGGGKDVHQPMLSSALSVELKAYASILWHATTALLFVGTGALLWAAMGWGAGMATAILVQYLAFAGLFLFYGFTRLKSVWILPQWMAFLLICALGGAGLWF